MVQHRASSLQLLLDPASAGERPLGYRDGLTHVVVDGVFCEPLAHQVHELAVAEWIDRAGGHLDDVWPVVGVQGAAGGHSADGGHHEVNRDDVDGSFGDAGKLLQETPGVGNDDRLGHPKPSNPAGGGFGDGRLDDGGADHAHRDGARRLGCGYLAKGLGVGVGVGEAERRGPSHAGLGHMVVHPAGSELLGLRS